MEADTLDDDPEAVGTGHIVSGLLEHRRQLRGRGSTTEMRLLWKRIRNPWCTATGKIVNGERNQRGINGGALVLPALHGGGDMSHQIMLLLSVADDFSGGAGKYALIPAMTGIDVVLIDPMGNPFDVDAAADAPVFGSGAETDDVDVASTKIIVNGVQVMTDADLTKCTGTMIDGPWSLAHLTSLVPEASAGGGDFAGLDAGGMDPMMNASPGWIKFARTTLVCEKEYGDGDSANLEGVETADGIPITDLRAFTAGTLIVEDESQNRAFVTTGRALLKFITPGATFAASWTLKSPPSPMMVETMEDGIVDNE